VKRFVFFILSVICVGNSLWAVQPSGGSDGPTPFMQVPAPRKVPIRLDEPISSFSILERNEKILYVSPQKKLKIFDLEKGAETLLGNFNEKLFPVWDESEKYFFSDDLRILKELNFESPGKELWLPPTSNFYFWAGGDAFLQRSLVKKGPRLWSLSFLIARPNKNIVFHEQCELEIPEELAELKVAQGHRYPEVLLFGEQFTGKETSLTAHFVRLERNSKGKCPVESHSSVHEPLLGRVLSVNWISDRKELAIITDAEVSNLYFGAIGNLKEASLPLGHSYIPNPPSGVVLNLNRQKGIGVYSLRTGRYFTLDIPVDRGFLHGNPIWVDSTGEKLFLSTRDYRDKLGGRTLFSLSLRGLN